MNSGSWFGWTAVALTCCSGVASIVITPALLLSHFALLLAAIAAGKRQFTSAILCYALWSWFHFGLHEYHLALRNSTNTAQEYVVTEFVLIHVVFVTGLLIGVVSTMLRLFRDNLD